MVTLKIITDSDSHLHLKKDYLKNYGTGKIFIETGTFRGDTVFMANEFGFEQIHSVELHEGLYKSAVERFADNQNIKIWQGDSAERLADIVKEIGNQPATFWLDAHASGPLPGGKSGGSPVVEELRVIASSPCKEHSIFIDDRRLFGSAEWSYVREEDAMKELLNINPDYKIIYLNGEIANDVICATLRGI